MLERTNFAISTRDITELPTIVSHVRSRSLELGIDYNLTFQEISSGSLLRPTPSTNLTADGNYTLLSHNGQPFEIEFDKKLYGWGYHKITPLLSDEISLRSLGDLALTYTFKETNDSLKRLVIGIALSSEENSVSGGNVIQTGSLRLTHHDGKVQTHLGKIGTDKIIEYTTRKYIYLSERCRQQSFNEKLFKNISKHVQECSTPCRDERNFGSRLNKILAHLPVCQTASEGECFRAVAKHSYANLKSLEPCNRIEYRAETQTSGLQSKGNKVTFYLRMESSRKVKIYEEYLIYDLVSMIGAIGGTLGLCIGFSFNDVCNFLLNHLESGIGSCQNGNKLSQREIMIQQARNSFDTNRQPGQFVNLETRLDGLETNLQNRVEELEKRMLEVEQK